jgi:PhzF family phenazine biosynthesis protein
MLLGMEDLVEVLRYAAFTRDPAAGNPAGVVLDAGRLDDTAMLRIAAEVGFSETAFLTPGDGRRGAYDVRYFSPQAEVPFCGHATVASAVALAEREGPGRLELATRAGLVRVDTARDGAGHLAATLTSVATSTRDVSREDLAEALAALRWSPGDLDVQLPPRVAYAGVHHLVLAAATRGRLAALDYDFERLLGLMTRRVWTTVQLVWREGPALFHARDPFPVGGVVEDPATGAAAAAFGGYLRELGLVAPPATLTLLQGEDLGRPSRLVVDVPAGEPYVRVTGNAVRMPA